MTNKVASLKKMGGTLKSKGTNLGLPHEKGGMGPRLPHVTRGIGPKLHKEGETNLDRLQEKGRIGPKLPHKIGVVDPDLEAENLRTTKKDLSKRNVKHFTLINRWVDASREIKDLKGRL